MLSYIKAGYTNLITSAGHFILLAVAIQSEDRAVWIACLGAISAISLLVWASSFRRNRAIVDTPTSRIGSAAQGYVELFGRTSSDPEFLTPNKMGSLPCVWYRQVVYRKNGNDKWEEISREVSDGVFAVEDGSGRCMIVPEHAEIITTNKRTWYRDNYKHVEEYLFPLDHLYALGEFVTLGGAGTHLDLKQDVAQLLASWKNDLSNLIQRFDLNSDGQVDMHEWELARRAAKREIERQHRDIGLHPGVHVMRAPANGQLYLLSNLSPQQLSRKYVFWSWFHLIVFFAAGVAAIWLTL